MYTIRDNKVGYQIPICDMSEASAIRNFSFGINNSDSVMGFSPSDYDLYKVGEFDTDKGVIVALTAPEYVVSGVSLKEDKK